MRIFEADVEVKESAGCFSFAGIRVISLVCEDSDRGRSDAVVGKECPDVG